MLVMESPCLLFEPGEKYGKQEWKKPRKRNLAKGPEKGIDEDLNEDSLPVGTPLKEPVFIDLRMDFAFKKVFGIQKGKPYLIRLINALLNDPDRIVVDLTFGNVEVQGEAAENRKSITDVVCTDIKGRTFCVEVQRGKIDYMISRLVFYICNTVAASAPKGADWNYNLNPHVGIVLADFNLEDNPEGNCVRYWEFTEVRREGALVVAKADTPEKVDQSEDEKKEKTTADTVNPPNDIISLIVAELPKLNKTLDELETEQDIFLYLIRNMGSLKEIPAQLDNDAYRPLFEMARFLNLNKKDRAMYTSEFKKQEVTRLEKEFYGKEEKAIGKKEKAEEIALGLYESGIAQSVIFKTTGVSAKRIFQLRFEKGRLN